MRRGRRASSEWQPMPPMRSAGQDSSPVRPFTRRRRATSLSRSRRCNSRCATFARPSVQSAPASWAALEAVTAAARVGVWPRAWKQSSTASCLVAAIGAASRRASRCHPCRSASLRAPRTAARQAAPPRASQTTAQRRPLLPTSSRSALRRCPPPLRGRLLLPARRVTATMLPLPAAVVVVMLMVGRHTQAGAIASAFSSAVCTRTRRR
mmetsp:Transcript_20899/g.52939  ORF Transcript_20899/g.52939 Transcript_20899/m.52939 type:complete len:209 (-) Transcript_20899:34-660(-)